MLDDISFWRYGLKEKILRECSTLFFMTMDISCFDLFVIRTRFNSSVCYALMLGVQRDLHQFSLLPSLF